MKSYISRKLPLATMTTDFSWLSRLKAAIRCFLGSRLECERFGAQRKAERNSPNRLQQCRAIVADVRHVVCRILSPFGARETRRRPHGREAVTGRAGNAMLPA